MDRPATILYFAWLRERTGLAGESLVLPADVRTLGALVALLSRRSARHGEAFAVPGLVRAAINQEFAHANAAVAPGDEIAFFPPITGG